MNDKTPHFARRDFLKASSFALGATALGFPTFIPASAFGASQRLTLGHIGVGGMGGFHLNRMVALMEQGQTNVAAVCDVDEKRLAAAHKKAGEKSKAYRDYRYVLERKDLDAVVIATPDHWHAVQTVHALQCGKHVYVEKPACCTIEEGKAMVKAASDSKKIVQVGSQGRSQRECYLANRYIANGNIGKVSKVTCWHYESPADNNPVPDSAPPPELDWDLWLGPLPWRQYNPALLPGQLPLDDGIGRWPDSRSRRARHGQRAVDHERRPHRAGVRRGQRHVADERCVGRRARNGSRL